VSRERHVVREGHSLTLLEPSDGSSA